ncbi:cob(I)yrinic acid a,c-diamide adenosyltransferase [Desulfopila sp. IMCC35008]|uniref:cob(I)yrinic acid a,c-diamide adenosyltransferase n=1 Tax=Desulfopila sp. IMCC35008 TaxID=2653858 RepID=UPI0013D04A4B|nr:cob(I)yrinic acid a,c-diamide adenosyltransferase [Desulfopila sp. IMCC35008]
MKITKLEPEKKQGLVVVITGKGKGKTTSAMGMALRSAGHGMKVCIIQFMKGDIYSGEWDGVKLLDDLVELTPTGKGFCGIQGNPYPFEEHRQNAQDALLLVDQKMQSGLFQTLILDEINNALELKLVDLEQVLNILRNRPPELHLIMTGRDAPPEIVEIADTVSEVQEIKHAYRRDIEPQPGIDY